MLLIIDNYDSFTYNLVHYLEKLSIELMVIKNDQITIKEIAELDPDYILLSPGPHNPDQAGITLDVITFFHDKIPILGVCLGHQAIGQAFGANIIKTTPMHGKRSTISHDVKTVFKDIPSPYLVTRYHSLVIERTSLPEELVITSVSEDGEIMGVRHTTFPIEGVQFHPESIWTEYGEILLHNFLTHYANYKERRNDATTRKIDI